MELLEIYKIAKKINKKKKNLTLLVNKYASTFTYDSIIGSYVNLDKKATKHYIDLADVYGLSNDLLDSLKKKEKALIKDITYDKGEFTARLFFGNQSLRVDILELDCTSIESKK